MTTASTISRDGTRIGWRQTGSGPPLLIVHGGAGDGTRWQGFAPQLSDRFTVYLVDRRGRGMSGDTPPYAIEREFEDIAAVAEAIGGDVTALGHSYGGLVVLGALSRTDAISRAICYEGWHHVPGVPLSFDPGDSPGRIQALVQADDRDGAVELLMRELLGVSEELLARMRHEPIWAIRTGAVHALPRELLAEKSSVALEPELRDIAVPVLFLIGAASTEPYRPEAEALCGMLKDARIQELAGQGHMAMDTAPELLAGAVTSFVEATL